MIIFRTALLFFCATVVFNACDSAEKKRVSELKNKDSFFQTKLAYKDFSRRCKDSIDDYFSSDFNGTVLLYSNGKMYRKAIGYSDVKRKNKMRTDDVFQLASVSKTVTAVSVLLLVQDKKIVLDSLVNVYLPDFPYSGVSVRQLLNHRSGLPNYMYFTDTFWKDTGAFMDNGDFYTFMKSCKPKPYTEPGVGFSYCNTNFAFLAVLVERISGMPFYRFVEERIFKPSGMRNSFYQGHKPARIKARVLTGRYDQYEYTGTYYMDGIIGDKSLYSTVDDLFGFHLALSEGRLLQPELLKCMQEPSFEHNIYGGSYGLGFRLMLTPTGQWTYHNGWWRGFWTSFWNRFDKKTCLVILTNNKKSSHVDKQGLADYLLKAH